MSDTGAMIMILSVFMLLNVLYVLALMSISLPQNEEDNEDIMEERKAQCNLTKVTERNRNIACRLNDLIGIYFKDKPKFDSTYGKCNRKYKQLCFSGFRQDFPFIETA